MPSPSSAAAASRGAPWSGSSSRGASRGPARVRPGQPRARAPPETGLDGVPEEASTSGKTSGWTRLRLRVGDGADRRRADRRRRPGIPGSAGAAVRWGSRRGSVGPTCPLATCRRRQIAAGVHRARRPSRGGSAWFPDDLRGSAGGLHGFLVNSAGNPCGCDPTWEKSVPAIRAIDKLADILANSENFLQRMHELGQEPSAQKDLKRLFSPSEAAEMVGRDRTTLARAESEIGVELPARNPENNRRVGYTLGQVQAFRAHFGTLPWRDPGDRRADRGGVPELQGRGRQVHDLREPGALPGAQGLPGAGGGYRQPGDHDLDVRLRAGRRDRRGRDHPAVPVRVPDDARLRGAQVLLAQHRPDPGVPRAVRGGARDRHAPRGADRTSTSGCSSSWSSSTGCRRWPTTTT